LAATARTAGATQRPVGISGAYTRSQRAWTTVFVMCSAIMNMLDTTIANVALPQMQGTTGASREEITWVLTSYIVALAIATPLTGWLTSRYSHKSVLLTAIGLFTVFSVLCGISTTVEELVLFRIFQGFSGAVLVPLTQSTLLDIYPPEEAGKAMAYFGLAGVTGPLVGPLLGGWLTTNFSWGWVFLVNLPIGVIAFIGVATNMHDEPADGAMPFDYFSYGLLATAVAALQLMLDRGAMVDWFESTETVIYAVVSAGATAAFVVVSATRDRPLVPRRLLVDRNFITGTAVGMTSQAVIYATMAMIPDLLAHLYDFPALDIGLTMAPRGGGTIVVMITAPWLMRRFGNLPVMVCGLVLIAISSLPMSWMTLDADRTLMIVSGVLQGLGSSMMWVPMAVLTFATIPVDMRAEAAAFHTLLRYLGAAVGISGVQTLTLHNAVVSHAELVSKVNLQNLPAPLREAMADGRAPQVLATVNTELTRQAAMVAYTNSFWFLSLATLALLPMLLVLRSSGKQPR